MARLGLLSFSAFFPTSNSSAASPLNSSSPGGTYLAFSPGRKTTAALAAQNVAHMSTTKRGRTLRFIGIGRVIDLTVASSWLHRKTTSGFALQEACDPQLPAASDLA